VPEWRWLPATWGRIIVPYLDTLSLTDRALVEQGLDRIRQNPYDSSIPSFPWKGMNPNEPVPRTARQALIMGPDEAPLQVLYAPYVDFPYIGAIAILPLEPLPPEAGDGADPEPL
jgi:hypothetical protein